MQLAGLTTDDIRRNIGHAKDRLDAALVEYESAKAELAWWQQGLRLIDPEAVATEIEDSPHAGTELFPEGFVFDAGARPTLRQAVVLVMRMTTIDQWTVGDISLELQRNGWLPERADAQKRVSDIAGLMVQAGQLVRPARGVYRLAADLSAALDADMRIPGPWNPPS